MASLYHSAVKRPLSTLMIFAGIIVLGIYALLRLPIDLYPDMEINQIMVVTSYSGAAPEDIENNVTKPIQNVLNGINGVKHIVSESKENVSVVTLQLNEGVNADEAINDARDKVNTIADALPDGAGTPTVLKFSMDDIPVLMLSVRSTTSSQALYKILNDQVVNPIGRISGVGGVQVLGARQRQINVYCDPYKLENYNITIQDVSTLIGASNRNVSAGSMDVSQSKISLRAIGEISDPRQLEDLPIAYRNGRTVYLRDVAQVIDGDAEQQTQSFVDNEAGAMIQVMKQSGANTVQISRRVLRALPEIVKTLPPDIQIQPVFDQSDFITKSINSLSSTIAITFVVVMVVVLLFLGRWRATFIIVLTIPISLISAFIYLLVTGNTLNVISLSSLSIAIGMVVDDAIVVLENITRHIERGSYPKQAAVHATNEVALSVISSTLTMLAVFLPMVMLNGMAGILFKQLGWIVSIVMIVSTVCAMSLTPTLCAHMLQADKTRVSGWQVRLYTPINNALDRLGVCYRKVLGGVLHHKWVTIGIVVLIFALSLLLGSGIKSEFMPHRDNGFVLVNIRYPVGTTLEKPLALGHQLTKEWRAKYPEIRLMSFTVGQPDASASGMSLTRATGDHIITMFINLIDAVERSRTSEDIAEELRKDLAQVPGLRQYDVSTQQGGGDQNSVEIEIYGHDFGQTDALAQQFIQSITSYPSIAQALSNRSEYMLEYQMIFDQQKLAEHGLNNTMVATALRNSVYGATASYYREDGDEYEVRVRMAPEFRHSLEDLTHIRINTPFGQSVRLSELGKLEQHFAPPSIYQKDRSRYVSVAITPAPGRALSEVVANTREVLNNMDFPEGITYKIAGAYEQQRESFGDIFILLILIIILVFIVMAAEFESIRSSFVIMFSVPFAFTGVILGLLITNSPLNLIALVGAIMLVGIVVKNGIVLIDYTILNRERGMSVRTALLHAGESRLRPVLMTTLTTVFGMVPMALGLGEGSEIWQPMGITVAFGLSVSTLITLLLIPVVYALSVRRRIRSQRKRQLSQYRKQQKLLTAK